MKILLRVMLFALLVPIVLIAFDEPFFYALNASAPLSAIGTLFPAAARLSHLSPFPEYAKTVVCVEWLFVPVYLGVWLASMPFWKERVAKAFVDNFIRKNGKTQWIIVFTILFMSLLICSDIFPLRFISIYTGNGLNDQPGTGMARLMGSSRFAFATIMWLLCLTEAVMYYIVGTALYVAALRAKNAMFRATDQA